MGAGLPTEGVNAQHPRLADVARRDVPTCSLGERLGDVRDRVAAAGWDACVVVSPELVVLGLLRAKELNIDPDLLVEQAMRPGPSTYRPSVSVTEMRRIMADRRLDSSPVTTSDGRLVGLVRKQDIATGRGAQASALAGEAAGQNRLMVSEIFDPDRWRAVDGFDFTDITYHRAVDSGTVRVAFNRPEVRNAFRPHTVDELYTALDHARMTGDVGCVLLTGNGPSPKDGGWAFCSGGDQRIRGRDGYRYADGETAEAIDPARSGRLHIMEVHRLIRFMPKVVICVVPGWAAGGGHSLHVVCDLTLASREHARFKQTDADVGSFDGGFGSAYLARQVGQKFAREIFFLGDTYDAEAACRMGMVNAVVPHADLERTALDWAAKINAKSPTSQRMLKYAFNLIDDGLVGQQVFAAEATRLAYMTDEAVEGRDAFLEKRAPDWTGFPYYY